MTGRCRRGRKLNASQLWPRADAVRQKFEDIDQVVDASISNSGSLHVAFRSDRLVSRDCWLPMFRARVAFA